MTHMPPTPCKQVAVNGTLVVPEHKPDIERILRVTSTPVITRTAVITNKVIFSGHILINVEYVASVPCNTQPVHFVSFKVPFADFIEDPCARPGLNAVLKIEIEFQEFNTISKRAINKLIILKVCVVKLKDKDCDVQPHPCPPPCINPCPPHYPPPGPPCPPPCSNPCPPHHDGHPWKNDLHSGPLEQNSSISADYSEGKTCPFCGSSIF